MSQPWPLSTPCPSPSPSPRHQPHSERGDPAADRGNFQMEISPGNFTREGRPPPKAEGPAGHKVEVLRGERPAEGLEAARASVLSSKLRGTMRTATILRTKASTGKCSATTTAKRGVVGSSATGSSGWAGRRGAPLRTNFAARGVAVGKDGFPEETSGRGGRWPHSFTSGR